MLLAIITMAATLFTASPAAADEPGMDCWLSSTAAITAPSPVHFGDFITVSWGVSSWCTAGMGGAFSGPGVNGEIDALGGFIQLRAVPSDTTMTWRLLIYNSAGGGYVVNKTITVL